MYPTEPALLYVRITGDVPLAADMSDCISDISDLSCFDAEPL